MKCNNCPYLYYPEYESNYTSCYVFGDEPPEKYQRIDGEGCKCNLKQLKKIYEENEKAWLKDIEDFCKWYLENEVKTNE